MKCTGGTWLTGSPGNLGNSVWGAIADTAIMQVQQPNLGEVLLCEFAVEDRYRCKQHTFEG